jgi:hypothetical protein
MKYSGVFRGNYFTGAWGDSEVWPFHEFVLARTAIPPEPIEEKNQQPWCATFWFNLELVWSLAKKEYIMQRRLRDGAECMR